MGRGVRGIDRREGSFKRGVVLVLRREYDGFRLGFLLCGKGCGLALSEKGRGYKSIIRACCLDSEEWRYRLKRGR